MMKKRLITLLLLAASIATFSNETDDGEKGGVPILRGLRYDIELQSTFSSGKTPLWLNANRYGLSSLETENGYARASLSRLIRADSARHWGIGYGVDVAVPYNFTSDIVVQQAFVEARWLHGTLSIGSKERPMELKNNNLSSGSQTLGINARPVPQVRLAIEDYWTLPIANGWIHLKGHIAYGRMTDDSWQHTFTNRQNRYADDVLYHSKAGYLKIGNDENFHPFSIELGLEMGATFGGTAYLPDGVGGMTAFKGGTDLKDFWNALVPRGSDPGETTYKNVEGNQVGSWLIRLNWDADLWRFSLYADKYFEDHSAMFQLDYDGYGEGFEWEQRKKHRYLLYDFKDIMLGSELNLKYGSWIRNIVFEYIYSKYQSGPIYHDHTEAISDHIGGNDDYYNHYLYTGWQHWGQVIGNPLYRSPIYNTDGTIRVRDNRFMAFHLGFDGQPTPNLSYRALASWQEGLGSYADPFDKKHHNVSFLVEARYAFSGKLLKGWSVKGGYAMDFGGILGNNHGLQITIAKGLLINL